MKRITYKGFDIQTRSEQRPAGGWIVAEVFILLKTDGVVSQTLIPPLRNFKTESEADDYGLAQGRAWVDQYAKPSNS
jgi:hypothetical protein